MTILSLVSQTTSENDSNLNMWAILMKPFGTKSIEKSRNFPLWLIRSGVFRKSRMEVARCHAVRRSQLGCQCLVVRLLPLLNHSVTSKCPTDWNLFNYRETVSLNLVLLNNFIRYKLNKSYRLPISIEVSWTIGHILTKNQLSLFGVHWQTFLQQQRRWTTSEIFLDIWRFRAFSIHASSFSQPLAALLSGPFITAVWVFLNPSLLLFPRPSSPLLPITSSSFNNSKSPIHDHHRNFNTQRKKQI